ncbi:MAG: rhomboid family intramembrane serine protease [Psychroflexus sp.]|nr:rhomboid family intramembrane serine protease [Psychroflexus sp.]MDR9448419.1 rhomboid family intramembrane serine protease [Psychroflexus sp.]
MPETPVVTFVIIAVNSIISFKGFNDDAFFDKYKFNINAIHRGNKLIILSSGFLHIDIAHLAVNMITLYFFAPIVVDFLGVTGFLGVYFISLLVGNIFSYYFHKSESYYTAVGASGAVVGILYSAILLRPDMMLGLFFILPIPAYIFGIGYLLYSIYAMKKRQDNIGHDAHFGGAMGGYFLTLILAPNLITENTLMVVLLFLPIVLLFILQKTGKL